MRYFIATVAAALLCSPAFADSFNFSSGQVVTHRGSGVPLLEGTNVVGKKNDKVECKSTSCSLVIQTRFDFAPTHDYDSYTLCTLVDGVQADPSCRKVLAIWVGDERALTSFQGVPNLTQGKHTISTQIEVATNGDGDQIIITGYQIGYTLYEHQ